MAKKYSIGALEVTDRGQMEKEEILVELLNEMQKYTAKAGKIAKDMTLTNKERLRGVRICIERFCGLSDFLRNSLYIDVRGSDGLPFGQEIFNRLHHLELNLEIELEEQE